MIDRKSAGVFQLPTFPAVRPAGRGFALRFAWLWPVFLLGAVTAVFELTPLDLVVQDRLFNFTTGRWLVDGREPIGRLVFYTGPKAFVITLGGVLLALAAGPARWRKRFQLDRRGLWIAVLTLASLPALAGLGKRLTNVHCPSELRRYGGTVPYVALCGSYSADDRPVERGHCFPAGHASGGFALGSIAWLRPSRRWRTWAMALGLGLGWWMGAYQMLKGAHYLSHTLTTLLLAQIVIRSWRGALTPPASWPSRGGSPLRSSP